MTKEYDNVRDAKNSLKSNIELMESMLKHLKGTNKMLRGRAVWASWCLHRYINDKLINDIQDAIEKNAPKVGENVQ